MLVTKSTKTVTNISKLSPTHFFSNIRHQHRCSPHHWWVTNTIGPCTSAKRTVPDTLKETFGYRDYTNSNNQSSWFWIYVDQMRLNHRNFYGLKFSQRAKFYSSWTRTSRTRTLTQTYRHNDHKQSLLQNSFYLSSLKFVSNQVVCFPWYHYNQSGFFVSDSPSRFYILIVSKEHT